MFITFRELGALGLARERQPFIGRIPLEDWSVGVYEMPNSKHQITNKFQIPILNDQNKFGISNFGHCHLFAI
jgi:hypothetical protein